MLFLEFIPDSILALAMATRMRCYVLWLDQFVVVHPESPSIRYFCYHVQSSAKILSQILCRPIPISLGIHLLFSLSSG